ncbi:MAG: hypothetical protein LBC02_01005 [Planctomycetaceae bacterium]|jgi:hypothetical protein|nr:hypothetical protein [Planctomycetaceae bacterium]
MNNAQKQQYQAFSVKEHIDNRPVAGRGVGAVQLPDGVKFFKFKEEGTIRLDIIPYRMSKPSLHPHANGEWWYERTYFVHKNVGSANATVVCPKSTLGKPCPICEYKNTLDYSDEEDLKRIKQLNPQERQLFNIALPPLSSQIEGTSGVITHPQIYVLDQSRYGFGSVIDDMIKNADEDDEHYQYYADLKIGSTLKLNLKKQNIGYVFYKVDAVEIKRRKYTYDESVIDLAVDLDRVIQTMSYGELKDMFFDNGEYDVSKQSSQSKPKSKSSNDEEEAPAKTKAKVNPPVDEDEDEDEEPPVKPKKKVLAEEEESVTPKKKPKPPVDEDEDEDNEPPVKTKPKSKQPVDEDEDEDNEPPAKVKSKAKAPVDEDEEEPPAKTKSKSSKLVDAWDDED